MTGLSHTGDITHDRGLRLLIPTPTVLSWAESSAVNYGNSVLGLHINRMATGMEILCAIAGKVPVVLEMSQPVARLSDTTQNAERFLSRHCCSLMGQSVSLLPFQAPRTRP